MSPHVRGYAASLPHKGLTAPFGAALQEAY